MTSITRLKLEPLDARDLPALSISGSVVANMGTIVQSMPSSSLQNGLDSRTMIALVNQLGGDAWTSMPHLAADDYVRSSTTVRVIAAPSAALMIAVK